ncbi:cell adhesion molecule 1-like isoform X2 [Eriocheir sinensis]|uniref:cell adhesion molecule 1-like isoform X2 n=1 Tax=Eriocheir sinensis TaxID=95602 RepID=UPI0021C79A7E|nr:cell adhesion molecule 1-like isoform X2 [Eriocheir sinensis]
MGAPWWTLSLLLLLTCPAAAPASDLRYLRHGGRREAGDGGGGGAAGAAAGTNATTGTAPPEDLLFEGEGEAGSVQEQVVVRGEEVLLECVVPDDAPQIPGDDSAEGEVRWYHDGAKVREDLRVSIMWTGRLVLSHAVTPDSGLWWCRRSGRPGPKRRLFVTIPPERPFLMYGGAQLAAGARLTTREGNAITLHCVVDGGNPAPAITWRLAGEDVTPSTQVRSEWREEEGVFHSTSNLTVPRVSKELHNATAACTISHPSLPVPVSVPLRLNIEYPPDFRLRRWPVWGTPVREGSTVSLLCLVDANPPSSPTWVKESEGGAETLASAGGWLNLTKVGGEDKGWYKCATSHPFGRYSSHSVFINVLGDGSGSAGHTPQLLRKTATSPPECAPLLPCPPDAAPHPPDGQGWVTVVPVNVSVITTGGRTTVLAARVCGRPSPSAVTWLPPPHLPPLTPGHMRGRLHAHNLTAGSSAGCLHATLSIKGVKDSDAGGWVVVGVGGRKADAALIHLNVTAAAHAVASAAHALQTHLLALLLALLASLPPRP